MKTIGPHIIAFLIVLASIHIPILSSESAETDTSAPFVPHFDEKGPDDAKRNGSDPVINTPLGGRWFTDFEDLRHVEESNGIIASEGAATPEWWDDNWSYRKKITIEENSGRDLTDYQVLVSIDSSDQFFDKASRRTDLTFVDRTGKSIDHWVETWNPPQECLVWLKVPHVPAMGSTDITMYYGSENTYSLGTLYTMFEHYDGFHTHDISDWTSYVSGANQGSSMNLAALCAFYPPSLRIYGNRNGAIETMIVEANHFITLPPGLKVAEVMVYHSGTNAECGTSYPERSSLRINDIPVCPPKCAESSKWTLRTSEPFREQGRVKLGLRAERFISVGDTVVYFDDIRVRKYTSPEPTSTIGSEETPAVSPYILTREVKLPGSFQWESLSVGKNLSRHTFVNITVENGSSWEPIPGFENLSVPRISLEELNGMNITSVRLRASFDRCGDRRPSLEHLGISWISENAWVDNFISSERLAECQGVISVGNVTPGENSVPSDPDARLIWRLDGDSANTATDSSGHCNHGEITGADRCRGFTGGGLRFAEEGDLIEVEELSPSPGIALEMRVRPSAAEDGQVISRLFAGNGTFAALDHSRGEITWSQRDDTSWDPEGDLLDADSILSMMESPDGSLYAGTEPNGDVFRSPDGGKTWLNTAELSGAEGVFSLLETRGGVILAGTAPGGKLFRSMNAGQSWEGIGTVGANSPERVGCLLEGYNGTLYAGTSGAAPEICRSTDGGATWVSTPFPGLGITSVNSLLEASDSMIYAATGPSDCLFRTWDGGERWEGPIALDGLYMAEVLLDTSSGLLLAGGGIGNEFETEAGYYTSHNDGLTWTNDPKMLTGRKITSLLESADGTLYATTGYPSCIYRSSDMGSTWNVCPNNMAGGYFHVLLEDRYGLLHAGTSIHGDAFISTGSVSNCSFDVNRYDEWTHLGFVHNGSALKIYVDGIEGDPVPHHHFHPVPKACFGGDLYSQEGDGGYASGARNTTFRGIIDEVALYGIGLSAEEMAERAALRRVHGSFRSENITLPVNMTWSTLCVERSIPENTSIGITLHDAFTGELLALIAGNSTDRSVGLTHVDAFEHGTVYLAGTTTSTRTKAPVLHQWGINWSEIEHPGLNGTIDDIKVREDEPRQGVLNLSLRFTDRYRCIWPSNFTVASNTEHDNFTLGINGTLLDVVALTDNWTGSADVVIRCTNHYNLSIPGNEFSIMVMPSNDAPIWSSRPPSLSVNEDSESISPYSLSDHAFDADSPGLEYTLVTDNGNLTASLASGDRIVLNASGDYYGSANVTVSVIDPNDILMYSDISIPVTVVPVNDPPVVRLLHPVAGETVYDVNVPFGWEITDIDNTPDELTADLYLGQSDPPGLYMIEILGEKITIHGLTDGAVHHWWVIAYDGKDTGKCGGARNFTVDTSLFPRTNLLGPSDGSVVNRTEVLLTWDVTNALPGTAYRVMTGKFGEPLSETGITNATEFRVTGLTDGASYRWKVIPVRGDHSGLCISGMWNFTVDLDFEAIYNIDMKFDRSLFEFVMGDNSTLNVTVVNLGNVDITLNLSARGPLKGHIFLDLVGGENVLVVPGRLFLVLTIPVGGSAIVTIAITNTSRLDPGDHYVDIGASFKGGKREMRIPVRVLSEPVGGGNGTGEEGSSGLRGLMERWWPFMVIVLGIILLFIVMFVVVRRRGRKEGNGQAEAGETGEAGFEEGTGTEMEDKDGRTVPDGASAGTEIPLEDREHDERTVGGPVIVDSTPHTKGYGYIRRGERGKRTESKEAPSREPAKKKMPHILVPGKMFGERYEDLKGRKKLPGKTSDGGGIPGNRERKVTLTAAGKSVTCAICFGIVKTGLPLVTCACGKKYHRTCVERVGECPGCGMEVFDMGLEEGEEFPAARVRQIGVEGGADDDVPGPVEGEMSTADAKMEGDAADIGMEFADGDYLETDDDDECDFEIEMS